ncbi:conserved oligomeric Golgi complex subunit 5 [Yersinia ruckeri]|uniref:hypothetical protein n=1 Tax=Yersinia ruckeri TaxID=29486 RepID=UPI0022645374|nr:hypothetical protein [Yersinia ruckeri]UZX56255.1 conserved oligomeric Golgi complex subunit 5 [Yersinia ruckeri]
MSVVTDWVSTGCNVVMASAAVYAAVNAKNWLSPLLHDQGLPIARELIELQIYPFRKKICDVSDFYFAKWRIEAMLDDLTFTPYVIGKRYDADCSELKDNLNRLQEKEIIINSTIKNINASIESLSILGWNMVNEKYDFLQKLISASDELHSNCILLAHIINIFLSLETKMKFISGDEKIKEAIKQDFSVYIDKMVDLENKANKCVEIIKLNDDEFKCGGQKVTTYFKIEA